MCCNEAYCRVGFVYLHELYVASVFRYIWLGGSVGMLVTKRERERMYSPSSSSGIPYYDHAQESSQASEEIVCEASSPTAAREAGRTAVEMFPRLREVVDGAMGPRGPLSPFRLPPAKH